ncbi:MAG: right-handed parallel beta-helix repeat-containing protein [bacterium]
MKKVLYFLVLAALGYAADLYVPSQYGTIAAAISAANDGDTVWVADGTYTGTGNKDLSWSGKHITVRSENGPDNCIIDCEHSGRGFYFNSAGNCGTISGFTIRNGNAVFGGGIRCWDNSSPAITNCIISGNSATNYGGGICCSHFSSPSITNCIISGNSATLGGGIGCYSSSPSITNCTISGNSAFWRGGGISCISNSSPVITNCIISGNSATWRGGGIDCDNSSPSITNCIISGNSAYYGGGIYCYYYSSPSITNCIISGNSAYYGGGICCWENSSPSITNCTISGNSATIGGGICCHSSSSPVITNCIISENSAANGGGIQCQDNSSPSITYDDVWNNSAPNGPNYYNCSPGIGCISADPLFVSPSDFHLQANSPCIDAGSNTAPNLPLTDKDGNPRIIDGNKDGIAIVDIGAYEFGAFVIISKEILYGTPTGYTGTEQYVPGGTLTYIITYRNIGNSTATNTSIVDFIPKNTDYASHTLRMGTIASTYETANPRTDAQGDDEAWYENNRLYFLIGRVEIDSGGRCYFRVYIK